MQQQQAVYMGVSQVQLVPTTFLPSTIGGGGGAALFSVGQHAAVSGPHAGLGVYGTSGMQQQVPLTW